MQYTCKSCRDISERKLLRKEMLCARCGGEIVADPQKMATAKKQMMIFVLLMAVLALGLIIYG